VRAAPGVLLGGPAEDRGEALVDPHQAQMGVEEHEAHRRLAEHRLGGGEIGLDLAQRGHVDGHAQGALVGGHDIDLGEALAAGRIAVGHHAVPLAAVEDLGEPLVAADLDAGRGERGDGVLADGLVRRQSEELGGPAAPLVDAAVAVEGEGGDTYV